MIKALRYEKDAAVRQAAAQALVEMRCTRDAVESLRKMNSALAVEPLTVVVLEGKDAHAREVAAEALGQIGDPRALKPLLATVSDAPWQARRATAQALVKLVHGGKLDEASKQKIFAVRQTMVQPHTDFPGSCHFGGKDVGIGVAFQPQPPARLGRSATDDELEPV